MPDVQEQPVARSQRLVALTPDDLGELAKLLAVGVEPRDAAKMLGWELIGPAEKRKGPVEDAECWKYIELFSSGASRNEAARALGRTAGGMSRACGRSDELRDALEDAERNHAYQILNALERRAIEGWKQEVYQGGKFVGYKQMHDTVAGIFGVKGVLQQYKDNPKIDVNAGVQVNFEDRSAQVSEMWRVLHDAGVDATEFGRRVVVKELPAAKDVLAEPSDV